MSYLINNQQNLNEVIFANRNKSYGAYAIRSAYGSTIFKSLAVMIFGFGTFMYTAYYFCKRNNMPEQNNAQLVIQDSSMVTIFDLKKDEQKTETKTETKTKSSTIKTNDEIGRKVSDSLTVETHSVNIDHTPTGTGTSSLATNDVPDTGGGKTTGSVTTTGGGKEIEETYRVDTQPEFEGGLNALYKFVSKNVRYPGLASEYGKQGSVYVKFVVDEKGKVGNLTLLNNVGYGMDEEALRVVGMIPNFKTPATVKGHPVKVYYQIPIKFKLN
ncbi:MAG: energy transducer TonB [Bacteroidetes bacterium]|nr:energy transducer TonB [Bacteroidota bacterium]